MSANGRAEEISQSERGVISPAMRQGPIPIGRTGLPRRPDFLLQTFTKNGLRSTAAPPSLTNILGRQAGAAGRPDAASLLVGPCGPGVGFEAGEKWWLFAGLHECRVEAPSAIGSAVISATPMIRCICARKHDDDGAIIADGFTSPVLQQAEEIFKAAAVIRAIGGHNTFKARGVEGYCVLAVGCWVRRVICCTGIVHKVG